MRGKQLRDLVSENLSDRFIIDYLNETEIADLREAVIIVTKGFLKSARLDELELLYNNKNILCFDYVDQRIRPELGDLASVYIASSIKQFVHFKKKEREKLVHMITHHPDVAIPQITPPKDYLNIGYFGEIVNAKYAADLQGRIDFCLTDTRSANSLWINRLRHCNMHYAVRQKRPEDGFKPFLKGFTAAKCGANIVVPLNESDATYYLGSDYPFILRGDSLEEVLEMIAFAHDVYGGPRWHEGLEMMASVRDRCSHTQICSEVRDLLDYV